MKCGFHWLAQLPDGRFIILYADPVLRFVHREVGTFDTQKDAFAFAKERRFELGVSFQQMGQRHKANDGVGLSHHDLVAKLKKIVTAQVSELFAAYPGGIGVKELSELYNIDEATSRDVLNQLGEERIGDWVRDVHSKSRTRKVLLPLAGPAPERPLHLTQNETAVMKALARRADAQGLAALRTRELAIDAGIPVGSINYVMHRLHDKKLIEIIAIQTRARTGLTTTVRLLAEAQAS